MKKILSSVLVAVCVIGLAACKPAKKKTAAEMEREWYRYISAYTYGTISRKSEARAIRRGASRVLPLHPGQGRVEKPSGARLRPQGRAQTGPGL
jgi:hypothetical protein